MDLNSVIMKNLSTILLDKGEEYYYAHIKENENYIIFYGYLFFNKTLKVIVGDVPVDVYDKKSEKFVEIENLSVFENLKELEIPKEYRIPKSYDTLGLKL